MEKPNLIRTCGRVWGAVKGFVGSRWGRVVTGLVVALVLGAVLHALYWVPGAGFGGYVDGKGEWQRGKTLWDWLDLLFVPLVLAGGAALFTWVTNRREQAAEEARAQAELAAVEKRAQTDREIELDRARAAALQTYLDRVTALLRDKWHESRDSFVEADIIRAQTLTVLRLLDGERKGLLLRFLYESGLIGKANAGKEWRTTLVALWGADLSGADLGRAVLIGATLDGVHLSGAKLGGAYLEEAALCAADLRRANLCRANLRWANLRWANLSGAELSGAKLGGARLISAKLRGADLSRANLRATELGEANLTGANLSCADLGGADLLWANLSGANLGRADLGGADLHGADLSGADLSGADLGGADLTRAGVTEEQLAKTKSLEGATMPDGTKYGTRKATEGMPHAEHEATKAEPEVADTMEQAEEPREPAAGDGA